MLNPKAQAQAHSSIEGDLMNGLFRLFHDLFTSFLLIKFPF